MSDQPSSDQSVVEDKLAALQAAGAPVAEVDVDNRVRHWIEPGKLNILRETVDGKPHNTALFIPENGLFLASGSFRDHRTSTDNPRDMYAWRADYLFAPGTWVGHIGADGNPVVHPLFADYEKFPWMAAMQLRLRVQNFVDLELLDTLEQVMMTAEEFGCVVDDEPTQRKGRDTTDLMRFYASEPLFKTAIPLAGAQLSVQPLWRPDKKGNPRDPFTSLWAGVSDQARRQSAEGAVVPDVTYLNGMTVIPQSDGALVPKPVDSGIFVFGDGTRIHLFGTQPATADRVKDRFAKLRERRQSGQSGAVAAQPQVVSPQALSGPPSGW